MRLISQKLKLEMQADPYYQKCSRRGDGGCDGRITWEHAIIFAGRQLNEKWAIIPLCEYHHAVNMYQDGGNLNKEMNIYIALKRATDDELRLISKATNYIELRDRLARKYEIKRIRG